MDLTAKKKSERIGKRQKQVQSRSNQLYGLLYGKRTRKMTLTLMS